jgi:NADH-quinone oxidoreductase subunit J
MSLDSIIFAFSAAVAVFGALMMVTSRNPVASVLYMIVSLVAQAVLYIQLSAMFIAAVLIIVYAGAILVLFLFVIMLLNLRGGEDLGAPTPLINRFTKFLVSILLLLEIVFVFKGLVFPEAGTTSVLSMQPDAFGSAEEVAMLLYTKYLYPFELTGVLLLVAIVGAVVIARRERPTGSKRTGEEG